MLSASEFHGGPGPRRDVRGRRTLAQRSRSRGAFRGSVSGFCAMGPTVRVGVRAGENELRRGMHVIPFIRRRSATPQPGAFCFDPIA
jgi:hypothetical protein